MSQLYMKGDQVLFKENSDKYRDEFYQDRIYLVYNVEQINDRLLLDIKSLDGDHIEIKKVEPDHIRIHKLFT